MKVIIAALVCLVGVVACKAKDKPAQRNGVEQGKAEKTTEKLSATEPAISAAKAADEARVVLDSWLTSQNAGDFDSYSLLFHDKYFKGVKRTTSGKVAKLDYSGWLADRKRMFKGKPEVAIEKITVRTWLDSGSELKPGVSRLRFLQRWRSTKYADRGIKIVLVWRDSDGVTRIIGEDLVNAEPGWDDNASSPQTAAAKLGDIKTLGQALTAWEKLAPTVATRVAVLDSIPSTQAPLMAEALLSTSDFDCKELVTTDECGTEYHEWKRLPPTVGLESPCLKRQLAAWAVDVVDDDAFMRQIEPLSSLIKSPVAEDPIVERILAAAPESDDALVALLPHVDREIATSMLDRVSRDGLILLFDGGFTEAVANLLAEPARNIEALLKALVDDKADDSLRERVLSAILDINTDAVNLALAELSQSEVCSLAMEAIELLTERGKKGLMPKRTKGGGDAERVLCLLSHASSTEYADKVLKSYIAGDVTVNSTTEHDFPIEEGSDERVSTSSESISRAEFSYEDLPPQLRGEERGDAHVNSVDITFKQGPDGGEVIDTIEVSRWEGCDC